MVSRMGRGDAKPGDGFSPLYGQHPRRPTGEKFSPLYGQHPRRLYTITPVETGGWLKEYRRGEELHRVGGPAFTEYRADGTPMIEIYYLRGQRHRVGAPAAVTERVDGVRVETYYLHGQIHRSDGPAEVARWPDGTVNESWFLNGRRHRVGGPAFRRVLSDGTVGVEEYWRDGTPDEAAQAAADRAGANAISSEER